MLLIRTSAIIIRFIAVLHLVEWTGEKEIRPIEMATAADNNPPDIAPWLAISERCCHHLRPGHFRITPTRILSGSNTIQQKQLLFQTRAPTLQFNHKPLPSIDLRNLNFRKTPETT
jgi:hypothetical protein